MFRLLTVLLLCAFVLACGQSSDPQEDPVSAPVLPIEAGGWTAAGDEEIYDTESIFAYINGHAEVYLAYGMQRCVSRRYAPTEGDAEIVVDLFEMASPSDAYGVFSHDRVGEIVAVGQGAIYRHGWLSFWKGRWCGSVYSSGGGEDARDAVVEVARSVADTLDGGGEIPALVDRMPASGLDPTSVCYLHSPQILNAHVYVGGDDLFGLVSGVEAVVGKYDLGENSVHLILVQYPNVAEAETVENRIRTQEGADGGRPAMVIGRNGAFLAAVVGAESDDRVESLLEEGLGGGA